MAKYTIGVDFGTESGWGSTLALHDYFGRGENNDEAFEAHQG